MTLQELETIERWHSDTSNPETALTTLLLGEIKRLRSRLQDIARMTDCSETIKAVAKEALR